MKRKRFTRREFLKLPLIMVIPLIGGKKRKRNSKGKTLKGSLFKKKTPAG